MHTAYTPRTNGRELSALSSRAQRPEAPVIAGEEGRADHLSKFDVVQCDLNFLQAVALAIRFVVDKLFTIGITLTSPPQLYISLLPMIVCKL